MLNCFCRGCGDFALAASGDKSLDSENWMVSPSELIFSIILKPIPGFRVKKFVAFP